MVWQRPAGPPKVWDNVEIVNADGKTLRFTIQEIPPDRYEEAIDHMCNYFVRDEVMCKSLNIIDDETSLGLFRDFWTTLINDGIAIAAFEEYSSSDKPFMAGVNVLLVSDKDSDKEIKPVLSSMVPGEKIITFATNCSTEANTCGKHGIDYYISALGLSVLPSYRRLGLGKRLLDARDKVGPAYGIPVTSTLFTSAISQATAAKAGFEVDYEKPYDMIVDENGESVFPDLKDKTYKVMEKKLF